VVDAGAVEHQHGLTVTLPTWISTRTR
jgi:hypothetical protein